MILSALLLSSVLALAGSPTESRPNLIVVLVDDLGWQDTSLGFGTEKKLVGVHFRTPNLERLARRGLTVTNAYSSSPVCSPSRVALLTGQSPARTKVTNWVGSGGDTDPNHPSLPDLPWKGSGLQPSDYKTLPQLLREAGYLTAHVGKAHFGAFGTPGADPLRLGFDLNVSGGGLGHPNSYYGTESFASKGGRSPGSQPNDVPGLEAYHGKDVFLEEALAEEASKIIRRSRKERKPLFLLFAPYSVHTPIMPNRKLLAKYIRAGLDPTEAAYATMVESVDNALGAIVSALESEKMSGNTVVAFTSDNGGLSQSSRGGPKNLHNLPLRSGKGSAYEGGIRVPFVIAGPGIPKGATLTKTLLTTADLFPTLLRFANVAHPPVDGENLANAFVTAKETPSSARFWHYPHYRGLGGPGLEPFSAIRERDFKLVFFYLGQRWEMYNLANDPGETMDLLRVPNEERRKRFQDLGRKLIEWLRATEANLPVSKSTGKPVAPALDTF